MATRNGNKYRNSVERKLEIEIFAKILDNNWWNSKNSRLFLMHLIMIRMYINYYEKQYGL